MDKLLFKRILIAVLSILAVVYVVYLLVSSNFDMYPTENAVQVTVNDTIHSNGFIIRDETVIENSSRGVLSYSLSDGEAVKSSGEIAKIYSTDSDAAAQSKADILEEKVNSLKNLQNVNAGNTTGIDTINNDINNSIVSFYNLVNNNDITKIGSNINSLITSINRQQVFTGKADNFDAEIAELESQISTLRNTSGKSIGTISAPKAGYFSAHCDGYENSIKFTDIDKIKLNDLENVKSSDVSSSVAGKVVNDVEWYIACKVTADEATELNLWDGDATVLFSNASSETIPASVERVYQETKDSDGLLILKCNYMNSELIDTRNEPIEIGLGTYSGLRISKKAIHDDIVTKTTTDENGNKHTEEKKVQGVYVLYGSEMNFKQISILYAEDDYVICDTNPDSDVLFNGETVSLYDKVIVEGEGMYDGKVIN
mgnify:CR=1 FL=1